MKPPAEDLERRRPVWDALSAMFLDTQIDEPWQDEIVRILDASGYSEAELDYILWTELCPVLHTNLCSILGVWDGFDMERVEGQILSAPAGRFRQWWSWFNGGNAVRHEWRRIKATLAARRAN